MSLKWVPKSVIVLRDYSRQAFISDLIAGVTVGLVALPLAMAFAIASNAAASGAVLWGEIPELLKLSRLETGTWLATFLLKVFADLTVAVEAGMIMAALVFIRKVTATTTISQVTDEYVEKGRVHVLQDKEIPEYVTIFRIHGPFLFGAADKIEDLANRIPSFPRLSFFACAT